VKRKPVNKAVQFHTRRQCLAGGMFGLSALFFGKAGLAASGAASRIPEKLEGRILGLTTAGPGMLSRGSASVMLTLDLVTGEQNLLSLDDYRLGHSLTPLPDGSYFAVPYGETEDPCLFLDRRFAVLDEFHAPRGYGFGGHAVLLPDNKYLVLHFNSAPKGRLRDASDTGQLCLVDWESRSVVHARATDILHGHDMIVTRDR